jgi:hypothetical protein
MAQIINTPGRSAYGGQAAGSALGKALEGLAGTFVGEFTRGKQRTLFEKQYPEHADILSQFHANPAVQQKLIANIENQRASQLQNLLKQQQQTQQTEELANYYESQGLPRDLAYQPKEVRNLEYKRLTKPQTWAQSALDLFKGEPAVKKPGAITQAPLGEIPKQGQVSAEQAELLRSQGYDVPLANESTSMAQRVSSFGTGFGAGKLGLTGDLLSGLGGLANRLLPEGLQLPEYKSALSVEGPQQQELQSLADRFGVEVDDPRFLQMLSEGELITPTVASPFPTSTELKKGIGKLAKGTEAEKYLTPQTATQKWYEDMGQIAALLSSPSKSFAQGGIKAVAKDLAKAAGVAAGGDTAGWLTARATGSELAGDLIKNGIWLAYNLFPGSLNNVAQKEASVFENEVIKKAEAANKTIDMTKYKPEVIKIQHDLNKMVRGTDAYKFLENEIQPLQEIVLKHNQDPRALWDYIGELRAKLPEAPDKAKKLYEKMIEVSENILENFGNTISKEGTQSFKNAERLLAQSSAAANAFKNNKKIITDNVGVGVAMMLMGGMRKLFAVGAGAAALNYAAKMVTDPTMQKYMTQLAKAGAANNTILADRLMKKVNKRAEQIDPKTAREVMAQLQQSR